MSFGRETRLQLPGRDFTYDEDEHSKNLRVLETWAEMPRDWYPVIVKDATPIAADVRGGTTAIVAVGDLLYYLKNGIWVPLVSTDVLDALTLDDLADVDAPAPDTGDIIVWDGAEWVSEAPPDPPDTWATVSFSKAGIVVVENGQGRYYVERACTLTAAKASVGTAPTGADLIALVRKNGSSTLATLTITAGSSTSGAWASVGAALAVDDYLTVNVTQIGSTVAGSDLDVQVVFEG